MSAGAHSPRASLDSIFTSAILPVVGVARIGYALGRTSDVAVDSLNAVGGVTVSELAGTVVVATTLVSTTRRRS